MFNSIKSAIKANLISAISEVLTIKANVEAVKSQVESTLTTVAMGVAGTAVAVGYYCLSSQSEWERQVNKALNNQKPQAVPVNIPVEDEPLPPLVIKTAYVIVPVIVESVKPVEVITPEIEPEAIIETVPDVEPIQEPESISEALLDASEVTTDTSTEPDYNLLTVKQLKLLAKARNIYIKSGMSKSRIIKILSEA